VPPPLPSQFAYETEEWSAVRAVPAMQRWVRALLVLMALGLIAVFAIAIYLNPYDGNGTARRGETHLQLGLPPCTFKMLTGLPCPSCGMTTSFSLVMHGDVLNSLRANWVGTLLAVLCLLLIPYGLISAGRGRYLVSVSLDWLVPRLLVVFCVLMLLRWAVVLWLGWY
jgi:hypothetical protein